MKTILRSILGVVVQAICLSAFIEISRTNIADIGKPIVVLFSVLVVLLFILVWLKSEGRKQFLVVIPASLAIGYSIAFHFVGLVGFPSLLADANLSTDYVKSLLSVTAVMFGCYLIATGFLYFLLKKKEKK